jgi:hypothetical protein
MGPKLFDNLVHPTYLKICNQTKSALGKVFKGVLCDSLILLITTCSKFFLFKNLEINEPLVLVLVPNHPPYFSESEEWFQF